MNRVLRHIRRAALLRARDGATDAQLVESFVTRRDEAAFEALLRRHGPMVMGVCRRVLRHAQDAEDAFQATFLVLARKAGSLRSRELLGNWLYGVAQRTAIKARAMGVKRRTKERQAGEFSCRTPTADGVPDELLARLDTELGRLPDKYRAPIVLCELEGKSRKDVARLLGLTEGTLSSRLARAKKLLARRLSRYGAAFSVGSLTAVLAQDAAACVRPALLNSTARAAVLTAGAVSARVIALTEGVMKAMLLSKMKFVWAVALAVVVGAGAVGLTYRQAAAQATPSSASPRGGRATADELEELRLEVVALRKGLEVTRGRVRALEERVETLEVGHRGPTDMTGGGRVRDLTRSAGVDTGKAGSVKGHLPMSNAPLNAPRDMKRDSSKSNAPLDRRRDLPKDAPNGDGRKDAGRDMAKDAPNGSKSTDAGRDMPNDAPNGSKSTDAAAGRDMPNDAPNGSKSTDAAADLKTTSRRSQADPLGAAEGALKKLRANPNDKQAADALERALQQLKERAKPKPENATKLES
jgi:RNA polymerase sigma factor (sigma-70 family)